MFPKWREAVENMPDDVRENTIALIEAFPLLAAGLRGKKIDINISVSFNIKEDETSGPNRVTLGNERSN